MRCWAKRSRLNFFSAFSGSGAHGDCADSYQNHGWHPPCVARRAVQGQGQKLALAGWARVGLRASPCAARWRGAVFAVPGGVNTGPRSASAQGGRHHQRPCSIARFPQRRQVAGPAARTALARAGNQGNGCAPHGALKSVLQRCSAHRPRTGSGIAAQKTVNARPVSVDCYEKSKPVASQPATGFSVRLPRAGGRPARTAPTQGGFSGPACHGTFFAVEGRCGRARRGPPR
jgi:hypothetical protein